MGTSSTLFSSVARLGLLCRHLTTSSTRLNANYLYLVEGSKFSTEFTQYATLNGAPISYFHDIPLDLDSSKAEVNMVVEIPRWSQAKFEILTSRVGNPIVQDSKNGKVRFVKNLFPYHGYIHNYGALPQTWENPHTTNSGLPYKGDNDPIDACEIGSLVLRTGDIVRVRVLGSLAMIDDGELDWKVIVIRTDDQLANDLYTLEDVDRVCPGLLSVTRQWFRDYKLPDGKPKNDFAFDGRYRDVHNTLETIEECHDSWRKLIEGSCKELNLPLIVNTCVEGTPEHMNKLPIVVKHEDLAETPIPSEISRNYFI